MNRLVLSDLLFEAPHDTRRARQATRAPGRDPGTASGNKPPGLDDPIAGVGRSFTLSCMVTARTYC